MLLQITSESVFEGTATYLLSDLIAALPSLVTALTFLVVAGLTAVLIVRLLRVVIERTLPDAAATYRQFVTRLVSVVLWFGIGLGLLSILGLEEIAAALGTASGFVALGVAYALSGMIADAVAGVYLLRDPDFNPGDEVVVGDMTGVVEAIELRKSRFSVDGDTVVRGNADIEKRWLKRGPPAD